MILQAIEDGLRAWIKGATGFPDAQIYFANQDAPQPQGVPFIEITAIDSGKRIGTAAEHVQTQDLTKPNGQEITDTAYGTRDCLITIQCFGEDTVSYSAEDFAFQLPFQGSQTAVELLAACATNLELDGTREALIAAGIAVYDVGTVRRTDAVIETNFEGRAVLEIRAYVTDVASESTGYIAEVQGTGTLTGDGEVDTVPFDVKSP